MLIILKCEGALKNGTSGVGRIQKLQKKANFLEDMKSVKSGKLFLKS